MRDSTKKTPQKCVIVNVWIDEVKDLKGSHETYEAMYKSIQRFVDNKARPYEH